MSDNGPKCVKCGLVMTPENARIHPEYFYHDACLPDELRTPANVKGPHILFRMTTQPEDDVSGIDDMPTEIVVEECSGGFAGLVVRGKSSRTGEWFPNYGDRHVIKRLLEMMMRVHLQHDEPCRLDHHGFCQAHYCGAPCLYAEIKAAMEAVELPIGDVPEV